MANIIVLTVILLILALLIRKIVIEKRRGAKCIGCPLDGAKSKSCSCHS